ncbi:MAG: hypothetical protein ACJ748_17335 [Flavisolibacter sp.]
MNEQNFEYLKDNLKYMGFGEQLNLSLENQLKQNPSNFLLKFSTEINKKPFEAMLNFRKSDNTDMYFFNSYHASLKRSNGETKEQVFYLTKGKGVTAKEAYNLLEGRAVHKELSNKEGQTYKAWIQLDFHKKDKNNNHEVNQYHENYGYNLKEALSKYAIAELKHPEQEHSLLQSLQKGNLQSVTIEKDGNVSKAFIEANPQFKSVNLYDNQMKRVQKESIGQFQTTEKSVSKEIKPDHKQEVKQKIGKDVKQIANKELNTSNSKGHSKGKSIGI